MEREVVKRYSEAFKRELVKEYERGVNRYQLRRRYGVSYTTLDRWINKYAQSGLRHKLMRIQKPEETDRVRALQARIAQLEKALAQETLEKLIYKTELEQAGVEVGKKNDAPKSSPAFTSKG